MVNFTRWKESLKSGVNTHAAIRDVKVTNYQHKLNDKVMDFAQPTMTDYKEKTILSKRAPAKVQKCEETNEPLLNAIA